MVPPRIPAPVRRTILDDQEPHDHLDLLRREFQAEQRTFMLDLGDAEWDKAAFSRFQKAMLWVCALDVARLQVMHGLTGERWPSLAQHARTGAQQNEAPSAALERMLLSPSCRTSHVLPGVFG